MGIKLIYYAVQDGSLWFGDQRIDSAMLDARATEVAGWRTSLAGDGAEIHAYDPESMDQARPLMPEVSFHDDAYSAIAGADALAIVTEWDAFRALDLDRVKSLLKTPIVVDLRNIYRPSEMRKRGFTYVSVGRR